MDTQDTRRLIGRRPCVAPIGIIASPSLRFSYYENDPYPTTDDPAHTEASAWAGEEAGELGLSDPVDPEAFKAVPRLGRTSCSGTGSGRS